MSVGDQKFLILKIGAIGDVLMSLPLVDQIRDEFPEAEITWVCGKQVQPILEAHGEIDRIITIDEENLYHGGFFRKFFLVFGFWLRFFLKRIDKILIGNPDPRYGLFFKTTRCSDIRVFSFKQDQHHSSAYLETFFGREFPGVFYSRVLRQEVLPAKMSSVDVILLPGGAKNIVRNDSLRRWPVEYYRELAILLLNEGKKVAVLGAGSDQWVLPYFSDLNVAKLVGKYKLMESFSVLKNSKVVVTHDSGPMHMAGTVGVPTLSIFGPTRPLEKAPSGIRSEFVWGGEELDCRPCYDGRSYADCSHHKCMREIRPTDVFEKVQEILR